MNVYFLSYVLFRGFSSRKVRKITEDQPEMPIFRRSSKRATSEYDPQRQNHTGHIGSCVVMHRATLFCIINKGLYF
jgi:hypothetical protein